MIEKKKVIKKYDVLVLLSLISFVFLIYAMAKINLLEKSMINESIGFFEEYVNEESFYYNTNICNNDSFKKYSEETKTIILKNSLVNYKFKGISIDSGNENVSDGETIPAELEDINININGLIIENIPSNYYIVIENDKNGEQLIYKDIEDGKIEIPFDEENINKYFVNIFSVNENCEDVLVRKISFISPRPNMIHDYVFCENNDDDYCNEYVYNESFNEDNVKKIFERKKDNEKKEKVINLSLIIGQLSLVIVWGIILRFKSRKRR